MRNIPFLHRSKQAERPTFPATKDLLKDLPDLPSAEAERALDALRRMISVDIASVYTSAGSHDTSWQVWLEVTRRRLTLAAWASEWLAKHPKPTTLPPASTPRLQPHKEGA